MYAGDRKRGMTSDFTSATRLFDVKFRPASGITHVTMRTLHVDSTLFNHVASSSDRKRNDFVATS